MFYFDPLYLLMVSPAIILALYAQAKVRWTFNKYSKVQASSGLSGAETSKKILTQNGLTDIAVERTTGRLSDYYDPRRKILALSPEVYGGNSLASLGVAAHETGHALQHARGYFPMKIRSGLLPVANFGSQMAWPLLIIGFLLVAWLRTPIGYLLINIGIFAFGLAVLFQVINLPVEYNASRRAMMVLRDGGYISEAEYRPTKSVLSAAALTYVAAVAAAILQLLYLVIRSRSED